MQSDRPSEDISGLHDPLSEMPWSADFVMQAIEILPVAMRDHGIWYFAPEHADSFIVGWPAGEKPEAVAARAVEQLQMKPLILHSTSWRHAGAEVVLTYLCVVGSTATAPESWRTGPMTRAELARGDATAPPQGIGVLQVQEHALRHLAWLTKDDPVIREELTGQTPSPDTSRNSFAPSAVRRARRAPASAFDEAPPPVDRTPPGLSPRRPRSLMPSPTPVTMGHVLHQRSNHNAPHLNVSDPTPTRRQAEPDSDQSVADLRGQVVALRRQNEALHEAALDLVSELSTEKLLQQVVDLACRLTRAQYGALGVLGPDGRIEQFITSGLSAERRSRVGSPPEGRGVLGLLNRRRKAIRVADISSHPRSVGFPDNHPVMRTFLGVPVPTPSGPFGNLYLTEKLEGRQFTEADEELVTTLANFAAVAVANSRLHQLQENIVSLVSHELRTPLSHIKGFASSLLQADVEWDEVSEKGFLESIVDAADRVARLVDDILDLARLETGGQAGQNRRPIAIGGPVRAGAVQGQAFMRDHRLRVQVSENLPMAFAEPGQIERVVTNLVENSAKYSQPGSSISVKVRAEPNTLIVSVTDRGPGIPSEEAERVFEKFVRLNAADAPAPPGTGLGLPLCKTIVEAHGGRIWYEPRRGGGARFSFTLPRSDPDA